MCVFVCVCVWTEKLPLPLAVLLSVYFKAFMDMSACAAATTRKGATAAVQAIACLSYYTHTLHPSLLLVLLPVLHCGPCRPALITNVLMACAILCPMLLLLSMPPLQAVVGYSKTLSTFLDLGSYVKHSI